MLFLYFIGHTVQPLADVGGLYKDRRISSKDHWGLQIELATSLVCIPSA